MSDQRDFEARCLLRDIEAKAESMRHWLIWKGSAATDEHTKAGFQKLEALFDSLYEKVYPLERIL